MSGMERVADYLQNGFQSVGGWCSPQIWQIIGPIARWQSENGVHNPVAEIGVYLGKFFIGLVLTKNASAGNFVLDVFDLQQFNLDGAGAGNLATLNENMRRNAIPESQVEIIKIDSSTITQDQIEAIRAKSGGGFSLFSVDGCHLAEHTIWDFQTACELTVPSGLVIVDDYTNPDWPGVQEGMTKMFLTSFPRFVPLVVAHNKMFLCHLSHHKIFLGLLRSVFQAHAIRYKDVERFGYECLTAHLDPQNRDFIL